MTKSITQNIRDFKGYSPKRIIEELSVHLGIKKIERFYSYLQNHSAKVINFFYVLSLYANGNHLSMTNLRNLKVVVIVSFFS